VFNFFWASERACTEGGRKTIVKVDKPGEETESFERTGAPGKTGFNTEKERKEPP